MGVQPSESWFQEQRVGKQDSASGKPFKCSVEEKNSKTTQECQFPFKLNDKTFTNCTDFQDPDGRLWCSTNVSKPDRQHIGGGSYWGYCDIVDGKCPQEKEEEILLKVIDTVQEQQQIFKRGQEIGLENQKNANAILTRILDQIAQ